MSAIERIGKYQIVGEIGEGAMGVVYKAHDPVLNRFVALKMISASLKVDAELRDRFQREAQAAATLAHPNIITIYDFGEEQERIYMAMELLVGTDLKELIGGPTLRRLEDKLGIMEQVCDGLAFAHEQGVVHRDIKPSNIHIQPNGQVKILDFGLARIGSSDITKTGLVMGTPNYMSPEQVMGERVDARSDVFSVGSVFYELLSNRKPFEADSVHGVMFRVVHKEPPPLRQWVSSLPPVVVQVVERALVKDREHRYQSAGELRKALAQLRKALESGNIHEAKIHDATLIIEDVEGSGPRASAVAAADASDATSAIAPEAQKPGGQSGATPPLADTGAIAPGAAPDRSYSTIPPRKPIVAGAMAALLTVGATAFWLTRRVPDVPPPAEPAQELGVLRDALVSTQIELAARDLQDKDYESAVAQAERVLRLAPGHTEARRILEESRRIQTQVSEAAAEARAALEKRDTKGATEALSRVLALDPRHPAATELAAQLNQHFRAPADDARAAMARARGEAAQGGAESAPGFVLAAATATQGEEEFARGEFASATRRFLEARNAFNKVRRTAAMQQAGLQPAERTVLPTVPPPPTARAFVTGDTVVVGPPTRGGRSGEMAQSPDRAAAVSFLMEPPTPSPGQKYAVQVVLRNTGRKGIKVKTLRAQATVDGTSSALAPRVRPGEIKPREAEVVGELSGTWPTGAASWTLDVTVVADKTEYKNQLVWR